MLSVGQDVRYGARLLWKSRAFSAIALAALALGIGATTAIFSVVDAVLLKPLPFREPGRLLVIYEQNPAANRFRLFVAPANFWDWQRQSRTLEAMAPLQQGLRANLGAAARGRGEPEELRVERVSAGLFPLLGVQPLVGRAFLEDEDRPGHTNFALLSHKLWQRRFAADRAVAGSSIRLREQSYTVLGVMPPKFAVLDPDVDLWVPLGLNPNDARAASARGLTVIGRLRPGVEIAQARRELDAIGARAEAVHPAFDKGYRPSLFPFRDELVSLHDERMGATERALLVLLAGVGVLLLMACVNVANLLLTRGAARRKEIAVRTALGATRSRVVHQLLAESMVLSLAGGAAGILLAFGAIALLRWLGPADLPRLADVRVDARLLLFALGTSLATGLVFGVVPALHATGIHLNSSLLERGRGGTTGKFGRILRSALVVVEVALAVVLLIGAGLLARSFLRLRAASPGFQADHLLTFRLPLAGRNASPDRRAAFVQQVCERIAALPGVRGAGAVNVLPLTGLGTGSMFSVEGRPVAPEHRPMGLLRSVTPTYFRAAGIPLAAGRDFSAADTRDSSPVVIVNQTLARRFFPDGNVLGSRLKLDELAGGWTGSIVGIVGNVSPARLEGEDWPAAYVPYAQWSVAAMAVVARTAAEPLSMASAVAREIHGIDPEQPVAEEKPMDEVLDRAVAGSRFDAVVVGIFALIAFALAALGIYGVISYGVTERTHELGIRAALGAQRADILRLVLGQGARLAACGIAAGLTAAWLLTRFMTTMLYGVPANDFNTYAAIAILLAGVALLASYIPSRRAMALDPLMALRHE